MKYNLYVYSIEFNNIKFKNKIVYMISRHSDIEIFKQNLEIKWGFWNESLNRFHIYKYLMKLYSINSFIIKLYKIIKHDTNLIINNNNYINNLPNSINSYTASIYYKSLLI